MQRTLLEIDNNSHNIDSKLDSRDRLLNQTLKGIAESIVTLNTEVKDIKTNQKKLSQRLSCSPKSASGCSCKSEISNINETLHDIKDSVLQVSQAVSTLNAPTQDKDIADIKEDIQVILSSIQGLATLKNVKGAEQPKQPPVKENQQPTNVNINSSGTMGAGVESGAIPKRKRDDSNVMYDTTEKLVLSDSLSRDIAPTSIDTADKIQIKTFGGANSVELERRVASFQRNQKVKKVMIQTPMKDSLTRIPDMERNLENLAQTVQYKFPNAEICASAVLPQKLGLDAKTVRYNTEVCSPVYKRNGVKFYNFASEFKNPNLYGDDAHLNCETGAETLAKLFKDVLLNNSDKFLFDKHSTHSDTTRAEDELPVHTERKAYHKNNFFQGFGCKISNRSGPYTAKAELMDFPMINSAKSIMMAFRVKQSNGDLLEKYEDDGEAGGGLCILKEMQRLNIIDCVGIVPRWLRDRRDHIHDLRWEIIADTTAEVASLLKFCLSATS